MFLAVFLTIEKKQKRNKNNLHIKLTAFQISGMTDKMDMLSFKKKIMIFKKSSLNVLPSHNVYYHL